MSNTKLAGTGSWMLDSRFLSLMSNCSHIMQDGPSFLVNKTKASKLDQSSKRSIRGHWGCCHDIPVTGRKGCAIGSNITKDCSICRASSSVLQGGIVSLLLGPVLGFVDRSDNIFFLDLHRRGWIIAPISRNFSQFIDELRLYAGYLTNSVIGYACFGQGQGLDSDGRGEIHNLLDRFTLLCTIRLVYSWRFGKSRRISSASGDAVLDPLGSHCVKVCLTSDEMGSLTRCVLGHLLAAILAFCLTQFL